MSDRPQVKIYSPDGSSKVLSFKEEKKKPENPEVKVYWTEEPVLLKPAEIKKDEDLQKVVPDSIEKIIVRQAEIYRKRNVLCNQNVELPEDAPHAARKVIVDQILELSAEYNKLAKIKKNWEKTGVIQEVEEKKPASLDKHSIYLKKVAKGKDLSKAKAELKKYQTQPEKAHKYKMKIERIEAELRELETLYSKLI